MACPRHLVIEHPVTVTGTGAKEIGNITEVLKGYFPLTSGRAGTKPCPDSPGKRKEALQPIQTRK